MVYQTLYPNILKLMALFFTNKGHQKLSAGKGSSYVNNSLLRFISNIFKVFRKGERDRDVSC